MSQQDLLHVLILTRRSPMKLGAFEKGKIIESLQLAIEILLKLLSDHPHLVNVVSRVFDPNSTFYAGILCHVLACMVFTITGFL